MECESLLADDAKLSTHDVYVYEAPYQAEDRYLVFSFALHYWFATNRQGAGIVRALEGNTIENLRRRLAAEYSVNNKEFDRDVMPFLDELVKLGFAVVSDSNEVTVRPTPRFNLDDPSSYPFATMFISLGDQCNLNCSYCFNKEQRNERLRKDSSRANSEVVEKAMREFKDLGGREICFTGGEPTLNPDLIHLGRAGKRIGLATNFITNGTRLKHMCAQDILDAFDHFAISLDSVHTAELAKLWGTGQYDVERDVLAPLARILSLAEQRSAPLRVSIKPTVTALNVKRLASLVKAVSKAVPSGRVSWDVSRFNAIGIESADDVLGLGKDSFDEAMIECSQELSSAMSRGLSQRTDGDEVDYKAERMGFSELGMRLPSPNRVVLPCAPSFFVLPTGDVYPCQQLELERFKLGNIRTSTLTELFGHKSWAELRQNMTVDSLDVCKDCELRYACAKHCHGQSLKCGGCTTAFLEKDTSVCRGRVIRKLWLETQQ